jgi:predicted phosphodiesterase
MRLRVLSDLHLEDNDIKSIPVYDANENDILTIVAGDLGGDLEKNCQYLTSNFSNCIFIGGNYICANPNNPRTIEQIREYYRQHFPVNNNITFLEKEYKIIDDYVFVGCTL